ncbi:unnamed protein product [Rangifer tarandus platyrhynchus]|uniref:Uncharacterized protein n=2 Tax=Rangifer tarandus platyrhynchus TaxID=3082113 RepID=A0AC59YM52_RANTA|nr:unnamed protein product [Rangifer tarandus platyrhynchus]
MTCRESERTRGRESGASCLPPPSPPAPAPPPLPTRRQAHARSLTRTHRHARAHTLRTHAPLSPARSHPSRPAPSRVQRSAAVGLRSRAHFATLTAPAVAVEVGTEAASYPLVAAGDGTPAEARGGALP